MAVVGAQAAVHPPLTSPGAQWGMTAFIVLALLCWGTWLAWDRHERKPARAREMQVREFSAWLETVSPKDFDRYDEAR